MSTNVPARADIEERPTFLTTEKEHVGVEEFGSYLRPSRLKVIQPTAGEPFSTMFAVGDVVIVPTLQRLAVQGQPFRVVPIFFFAEWCMWNPIKMKGQLPAIRERSLDPKGELAIASRNPATRERPCPENPAYTCQISEHLNVLTLIQDEMYSTLPVLLSFFRGEHNTGSNFLQLIKLRQASIFGCIFEARSSQRTNVQGKWYGLDFTNPADGAWVKDEAQYEAYKLLHLEFKRAHDERRIVVDFDDSDIAAGAAG